MNSCIYWTVLLASSLLLAFLYEFARLLNIYNFHAGDEDPQPVEDHHCAVGRDAEDGHPIDRQLLQLRREGDRTAEGAIHPAHRRSARHVPVLVH